jgi:polysaccharide deacetylase family protein (PEP-CTERM system associated)
MIAIPPTVDVQEYDDVVWPRADGRLAERRTITNALSVDVEEYYHAAIFRSGTSDFASRRFESRVEKSLDQLLQLLSDHAARATFFVLGEIARLHPSSVRALAALGHEVACHGDGHDDVYRFSPREFRADIRRAKARIEDVVGAGVIGYRAPNFSIGLAQSWAYQILVEEGFRYDSSLYPILHDRYGQATAPRFPYKIWWDGGDGLVEFPIGTTRLLGVNLPVGGGGYFRLLPISWFSSGIRRVNRRERRPVMFYLHPWELDPGQPCPDMPWRHRFRHRVGLEHEAAKLAKLFARFAFGTAQEVLEDAGHISPAAMSGLFPPPTQAAHAVLG